MDNYQRIRRQQILREAEGYLDLIIAFSDQWPLDETLRDRLGSDEPSIRCSGCPNAVASSPHPVPDWTGHRAMEQYREAIPPLESAAELDPENLLIWLALGWCYKRSGRLDLAIQSLEKCLGRRSPRGDCALQPGLLLESGGEHQAGHQVSAAVVRHRRQLPRSGRDRNRLRPDSRPAGLSIADQCDCLTRVFAACGIISGGT